jgi:predicted nucleotidyltransferase
VDLPEPYQTEVKSLVNQICAALRPRRIILFGSLAEGRVSQDSDIDLLVVMHTQDPLGERISRVYRSVRHTLPLDALVYTPEEMDRGVAEGDPFILDIVESGRVLFDAG